MQVETAGVTSAQPDPGPTAVADALEVLSTVKDLPLDDQPDAYQAVHEHLRRALADIDDA